MLIPILKKVFLKIISLLPFLPYWDKLIIKYCKVGKNKEKGSSIGKLIYFLFCKEYYTRSLYRRIAIQEKLGGGVAGAAWAEYYFKARGDYPPKVGERKQGNIEWHDANPGIKRAINLISGDPKNFSVIQLGASSGKVISHLAENFPESFCIYSDIFEEVTSFAEKKINLPNLEFVTCPSESLPALVQVAKTKKVLIISIGSSQYVQPENVDKTFRLLSKVKNKEIDFILDELGSKYKTNLNNLKGSKPRGKLSYTHNYKYYAEKNGFKTNKWGIIEPYNSKEEFPIHHNTVHLSGWFTYIN